MQKKYTKWQEATRKDIERAFGVLKGTWQFLDRPILLMDLSHIALRVTSCIILHNILVSDRVMGEVGVVYNPSHVLEEAEDAVDLVQQPEDLGAVQVGNGNSDNAPATISGIGIRNAPRQVQDAVTRRGRFQKLTDELEHQRLHSALAARFV
jgi:Plant transposon protein